MKRRREKIQNALSELSKRTRTPLPALLTSFALLHELTAIAPLFSVFYLSKHFQLGENTVNHLRAYHYTQPWLSEADAWAARVGRRYGLFGYQKKEQRGDSSTSTGDSDSDTITTASATATPPPLAGDVANALVAYCATKALLPARIALSIYFAPAFSRRVVHPISRSIRSLFKHR